jgi:transmembrane sensor
MTEKLQEKVDAERDAAADWLVRLSSPATGEADWTAFDAWLTASPARQQAYDEAMALWSEFDAVAPVLKRELDARPQRRSEDWGGRRSTWGWTLATGLAAAALVAAIVPWSDLTASTTVYQTAKGERRQITLADGSHIDMNAGSRLSVRLGGKDRRVTMDDAEAVFDVAKDASRPFLITAGDRTVRVVGTQFNVRRRDGVQSVTVSRGVVEVMPVAGAGKRYRLTVGQRLDHVEGASDSRLRTASPEDVESWRSGRLIYRDEPLANVAADLCRYTTVPVRVADARTGQIAFSGVLTTDQGDGIVRSLALLAPVTSTRTKDGILLRVR